MSKEAETKQVTFTCPFCGEDDLSVDIPTEGHFYLWTFCHSCCEVLVMLIGRDKTFVQPSQEDLLCMPKELKEEMRLLLILAANFIDRLEGEDDK